jgi:hypothetical protein
MDTWFENVPTAIARAACCAGLAALAASCGVRDTIALARPGTPPFDSHHLYVGPNGRDSNPGTEPAPFRTIGRAASEARPGTTVHVAPGSYPGGFKTTANGIPQARVLYLSTVRWGAKIVPPADSANPTAWDNRGNYVDIVGFEVDGTSHQNGVRWLNGIYSGGSYDTIRGNHVHHIATTPACPLAGGAGIVVDSYFHGIESEIIGNHVHDIGPAGCRFIQGIKIDSSAKVANNVVGADDTVTASKSGIVAAAGDQ